MNWSTRSVTACVVEPLRQGRPAGAVAPKCGPFQTVRDPTVLSERVQRDGTGVAASATLTKMSTVLEREMYSETGAARLLRVPPATLHYWLEGGRRNGKTYQPIIRETPTGSRRVTWAEFIEATLLREYRKDHKVPMQELRVFISLLRDRMGVRYPLAHAEPYVSGRQLVWQAQRDTNLAPDFALVAEVANQYLLLPAAESFVQRVTWRDDVAATWRPDAYADSPVVIDPGVDYGSPTVRGVKTEILAELAESGEDEQDLAELYDLSVADVRRALAYEWATEQAA